VRVLRHLAIRRANHHAPSHSQVDDPLRSRCLRRADSLIRRFCLSDRSTSPAPPPGERGRAPYTTSSRFQIEHDVLSYPPHPGNALRFQSGNNLRSRRFQRLGLRSQPDRFDGVSGYPRSQTSRDGFNFRKFGHENQSTVVGRQSSAQPASDN